MKKRSGSLITLIVLIAFVALAAAQGAAATKSASEVSPSAKFFPCFKPFKVKTSAGVTINGVIGGSGPRPYQEGDLGVVKEGAYADLLLMNGNPLENLDLVADPDKNFSVIMKDGKICKNTVN